MIDLTNVFFSLEGQLGSVRGVPVHSRLDTLLVRRSDGFGDGGGGVALVQTRAEV
jgi:hypothetical protein